MKQIELSGKLGKGKIALVDDEDFERINRYRWSYQKGYAVRREYLGGGRANARHRALLMHRAILDAPDNMHVDHKNRDKLDNQSSNLRLATRAQNRANSKSTAMSGYKGVYWSQYTWQAAISINGKRVALGRFRDPVEAARVYDIAAEAQWGEFARINGV